MSPADLIGLLLACAVLAAAFRQCLRWRRFPTPARPAPWRIAALLALQLASAALLYRVLLPPQREVAEPVLVVLTAGTDAAAVRAAIDAGHPIVALPEADPVPDVDAHAARMPDLATALRMHPGASRLRVLGQGLAPRDQGAAAGRALDFEPTPLPRGFIELQSPPQVVAGAMLRASGRVHGADAGVVELLDPAGAVRDWATIDRDGRFIVQAATRASGPASYRLRLRADATDSATTVEEAVLPVMVMGGGDARILFLAGAPNPEVKYLRRWATDAGLRLHSRMALGGGVAIGDAPVAFDADTLAGFDLAIVDERAWSGLDAGARTALGAAVDEGLGLMLRITAPPDADTRAMLRGSGFNAADVEPDLAQDVHLADAPRASADDPVANPAIDGFADAPPPLARQRLRLDGESAVPLLRDRDGAIIALWRSAGRGRIAVWNLDQSYRLVLGGHADLHAHLWSDAVATLARPRGALPPHFAAMARQGKRAILCGIETGAPLVADDGSRLHPLPDPVAAGCAAVWPPRAGWHRLGTGDEATHLYVRDAAELPSVEANSRREATLHLAGAGGRPLAGASAPRAMATAPRWPWLLAWLAVTGLLWWLERARRKSP